MAAINTTYCTPEKPKQAEVGGATSKEPPEQPGFRSTAYLAAAGSIAFAFLAVASTASIVMAPAAPVFAAMAMACALVGMVAWHAKQPDHSTDVITHPPAITPASLIGNYGIEANQLNVDNDRSNN